MHGSIRELPHVLHILGLDINFIFLSEMDDAKVKKMFEKEMYMMV
jgi:hypothetical protein